MTSAIQSEQKKPITKSAANLLRWIDGQYELHLTYYGYGKSSDHKMPKGTALRLSKARKALLRTDLPGVEKEPRLEAITQMLAIHAIFAYHYNGTNPLPSATAPEIGFGRLPILRKVRLEENPVQAGPFAPHPGYGRDPLYT